MNKIQDQKICENFADEFHEYEQRTSFAHERIQFSDKLKSRKIKNISECLTDLSSKRNNTIFLSKRILIIFIYYTVCVLQIHFF